MLQGTRQQLHSVFTMLLLQTAQASCWPTWATRQPLVKIILTVALPDRSQGEKKQRNTSFQRKSPAKWQKKRKGCKAIRALGAPPQWVEGIRPPSSKCRGSCSGQRSGRALEEAEGPEWWGPGQGGPPRARNQSWAPVEQWLWIPLPPPPSP